MVGPVLELVVKPVDRPNRLAGEHPLAFARAGGQPDQFDGPLRLREPDVSVAVVGVRQILENNGSVSKDNLAELVRQLLADLLAGGGRDLSQVQAAEGALRVVVEVGGQERVEGRARGGDLGSDIQRGGILVPVLQGLPCGRRHDGDLGHGLPVEQPAAVRLAPQPDPAAVRAGEGEGVAGYVFQDALGGHVRSAQGLLQLDSEQVRIAQVGRQLAQVEASGGLLDVRGILPGAADCGEQGLDRRPGGMQLVGRRPVGSGGPGRRCQDGQRSKHRPINALYLGLVILTSLCGRPRHPPVRQRAERT